MIPIEPGFSQYGFFQQRKQVIITKNKSNVLYKTPLVFDYAVYYGTFSFVRKAFGRDHNNPIDFCRILFHFDLIEICQLEDFHLRKNHFLRYWYQVWPPERSHKCLYSTVRQLLIHMNLNSIPLINRDYLRPLSYTAEFLYHLFKFLRNIFLNFLLSSRHLNFLERI